MCLTNEHVGPKILAKTKIYILTRAELLFKVCYEIPCITGKSLSEALIFASTKPQHDDRLFIELQVQYIKIPSSNHVMYRNWF